LALKKAGIKAVITILPKSAITRLTAAWWTRTGAIAGIECLETASMEQALELAKPYTK
jgi:hypothetical protein